MRAVIPRIYQEKTFIIFVKTYPVSSKFTKEKGNKQATLHIDVLGDLSALIPVYLILKSSKI